MNDSMSYRFSECFGVGGNLDLVNHCNFSE